MAPLVQMREDDMIVAAGIAERSGRILVARREGGEAHGKWEFPGGKVERGESPQDALAREFEEEFGAVALVGRKVASIEIVSPRLMMRMFFHEVRLQGKLRRREHSAILWVLPADLAGLDMLWPDALVAVALARERRSILLASHSGGRSKRS